MDSHNHTHKKQEPLPNYDTVTSHNLERFQQATHFGVNLQEVARIIKIHKFTLLTFAIMFTGITSIYSFFETPKYKSSVVINTLPNDSFRGVSEITSSKFFLASEAADSKIKVLIEYFKSPYMGQHLLKVLEEKNNANALVKLNVFKQILSRMGIIRPLTVAEAIKIFSRQHIESELTSYLSISTNFNNFTISIEATTPDPNFSAFLANEASKALLEINKSKGVASVTEVKDFLTAQETELGAKLQAKKAELAAFQAKYRILSENTAAAYAVQNLDAVSRSYQEVQEQLESNQKIISNIQIELKNLKENVADPKYSRSGIYLAQLLNRLNLLQYQQAVATNPQEKKQLQTEIDQLAQSYKKALDKNTNTEPEQAVIVDPLQYYNELQTNLTKMQNDNQSLKARAAVLEKSLGNKKKEFANLVTTSQKLGQLQNDLNITQDLYMIVKKKIQDTQVYEMAAVNDISILSEATPSLSPHSAPQHVKILFSLFAGLFVGFSIVFLKESLIPTIRSRTNLERFGFTVLGEVPSIHHQTGENIIVLRDIPNAYEADVYRSVRMKLMSDPALKKEENDPKAKTILMTSARGGNGKTFTAVNLSMALANAQYKVLLVDLDLRNPSIQHYFSSLKFKNSIDDMKKFEAGEKPETSLITEFSSHLHVIFGKGTIHNPAEFLDSLQLKIIEDFKKDYDYIILDMPPVLGLIDTLLVAPHADSIIFVAEHRKTYIDDIALAKKLLDEVVKLHMFAIINFVHREFTYYDNLRYYQYRGKMRSIKSEDPGSKNKVA